MLYCYVSSSESIVKVVYQNPKIYTLVIDILSEECITTKDEKRSTLLILPAF